MGLLQGPRLIARTTKSPIRRNHWVPLGCRGHLGSVNKSFLGSVYWSPSIEPICRCHSKRNSNNHKSVSCLVIWASPVIEEALALPFFSSFKKQFKVVCVRTGLLSSKKKTGNFFFRKDKKLFKMFPLYISLNAKNINLFLGFSISQNHHHKSAKTDALLCLGFCRNQKPIRYIKGKNLLRYVQSRLFSYCTYHF